MPYPRVEQWSDNGFTIAAKFPRSIVHGGEGRHPDPDVILLPDATYSQRDGFLNAINLLGDRLGPLVIQFPYFSKAVFASSSEFIERLDRFLTDLPNDFRYAVEIRNRNWLSLEYADLLRGHDVSLVLVDQAWMPHGDQLEEKFDPVTTDFAYIRLLGDRKEIESITESWDKEVIDRGDRIERWADLIEQLVKRDIETLIYANNHYAGYAPATADRLYNLILDRLG
jgi:uncharacterized protein YecE (DUF72 family)